MKELSVLAVTLVISFTLWVVTSIFNLQASYSDITKIAEDVKIIKICLINGDCREK